MTTFQLLTETLSVAPQLQPHDIDRAARLGIRMVINARPDGEEPGQPAADTLRQHAEAAGIGYRHIPMTVSAITDADVRAFDAALGEAEGPALAFCRSGMRAAMLWALSQAGRRSADDIVRIVAAAGYDVTPVRGRLAGGAGGCASPAPRADVVIVGGGSGGIATAASLKARQPDLDIVIIEPREQHYYQPGWTMVGGGVFDRTATVRPQASVIPRGVRWLKGEVASFQPDHDQLTLADGTRVSYRGLAVAPGNVLNWKAIEGLTETLGRNGVTSNYSYDTAPYTWQLAQNLREGVALFTQPPMPIKCAGAPQKAMYLSADHWRRQGVLPNIEVAFHNAGAALFGVKDYVPALMSYVERYGIDLRFESRLVAVDGPAGRATFAEKDGEVTRSFDMLHVTPPQKAPDFVARSPLADAAGYVEVDQATLQHRRYANVFGLGDGCSTPNAKTMAAARKQAPVVAENLLAVLAGREPAVTYDGYGSCPLTVERGKIVLAEFGYGGKLLPSFPKWLLDGTKPLRRSWWLKAEALPWVYWEGMLKGREWLARPAHRREA